MKTRELIAEVRAMTDPERLRYLPPESLPTSAQLHGYISRLLSALNALDELEDLLGQAQPFLPIGPGYALGDVVAERLEGIGDTEYDRLRKRNLELRKQLDEAEKVIRGMLATGNYPSVYADEACSRAWDDAKTAAKDWLEAHSEVE